MVSPPYPAKSALKRALRVGDFTMMSENALKEYYCII